MSEPGEWRAEEVWESEIQGVRYHGLFGDRDVLIIRSSESLEGPGIVPRKKGTLTAEDKDRLTSQGIPEECWGDDVKLIEARYRKEKEHKYTVLTADCESKLMVMQKITMIMKNTDKPGVILHYIGPGEKDTGNWSFGDGSIAIKDLTDIYISMKYTHDEPKCLEIISDCSYSGKWVSKCREFLNGAGVQPCGHSAMEKNILLKVKTSCRSHEIPHTLLYSARGLVQKYGGYQVVQGQHLRYLDNTVVRCKPGVGFDKPCDGIYDWHKKIYLVRSNIKGRKTWQFVMVEDEDAFLVNIAKHQCPIIKSGGGQDPPEDVHDEMKQWHSMVRK